MSKILSNIYIGSLDDSFNNNNCECILNVASEINLLNRLDVEYKKIAINKSEDIRLIIPDCIDYINKNIKKGYKIFIHCSDDQSRCICIAIAYLCIERYLTFYQAVDLIKKKSKVFNPDPKLLDQVKSYFELLRS